MQVKLKDGSSRSLKEGSTCFDLAKELNLVAPHQAVAVALNEKLVDFNTPLSEGDRVIFYDFFEPIGREVFWHTSAHVLAQAILRLYPDAKPTIGPPIENGFYYDFANLTISDADFEKIEEEMQKVIKENYDTKRVDFTSKSDAFSHFKGNHYKCQIIQDIPDGESLSGYWQGEFFDLCRGPHMSSIGKIKALKILKTSGAYWRGNSENEMLTRVYAITYPDRKLLKEYLDFIEEAKKRDHKVLGPKLDLFSLHEEAAGMPFFHPKGMRVWESLTNFVRKQMQNAGYVEIKTPAMMRQDLWEKSGHWSHYRHNMFTSKIEEREFAIKPMNCPGCMLFYKSQMHSYRELPFRVAEIGNVHRYEPSGSLSGLFRVRSFHQDDAHIFMTEDQIKDEILRVIGLADEIYSTFGLTYTLELSTRPAEGTIGTDREWEVATEGLRQALEATNKSYKINEGDGAFYGPKIDFHIKDALGRTWQCGTIQLDMALPQKFELEYTAQDGVRKRPVMIHRALLGSVERFFGILIEHFAGRFPFWISPNQVQVITVADRHVPFAQEVVAKLIESGYYAALDDSAESVSKKVRSAQVAQANYILTIGDREMENKMVALRTRNGKVVGEMSLNDFIVKIGQEKQSKSLTSPWDD